MGTRNTVEDEEPPSTHAATSAAGKQENTNDKPFLWTAAAKTKLPTTSKRTCNAVAKLLLLLPLQNLSSSRRQQLIRQLMFTMSMQLDPCS